MITMSDITKSYRGRAADNPVLSHLNAVFDGSEDIGILGGNGSGKSTLIRLLAGMDYPDSGEIIRSPDMRVSYPLSYSGFFHPHMSGRDNVRFIARLYGADENECIRFVREFAEIGRSFDQPLGFCSSSVKSRIAFAMSLAIRFDIYLVDEVSAVGDVAFKRRCMAAFAERRKHAKIIMVSQAVTTIRRMCTRGAVIVDGQLSWHETMADAINEFENQLGIIHV